MISEVDAVVQSCIDPASGLSLSVLWTIRPLSSECRLLYLYFKLRYLPSSFESTSFGFKNIGSKYTTG